MSDSNLRMELLPRDLVRISDTELRILETLMNARSGNAYSLWKQSKLKHYPTVLRTLKKLAEKNLIDICSKNGLRRETAYALTVLGSLVLYTLRNEMQEILDFMCSNSRLFRDLLTAKIDRSWVNYAINTIFLQGREKGRKINIDDIVRNQVDDIVNDDLGNIDFPDSRNELKELYKIDCVRPMISNSVESWINSTKQHLKGLIEFKKELIDERGKLR